VFIPRRRFSLPLTHPSITWVWRTMEQPQPPRRKYAWAESADRMRPLRPIQASFGQRSLVQGAVGRRQEEAPNSGSSPTVSPRQLPPPAPLIPAAQRPLPQQAWFHGLLSRSEVQSLLSREGDFLVRKSRGLPGRFVLSVRVGGQCKHFLIRCLKGKYHLERDGSSFPSIPELIHHHLKTHQGLTEKCPVPLRNPVTRVTWDLSHEDVILGELLGSGNFGKVYSGRLSSDNTPVAVKTYQGHLTPETKERFLREAREREEVEVQFQKVTSLNPGALATDSAELCPFSARILRQYRHPNIVRIIGVCAREEPFFLVMELVSGGDFLSFLRLEGKRLWVSDLVRFAIQAAAGMAYLESHRCIHRDLAARNCLVGEGRILKISDFGMSQEEEESGVCASVEGLKHIPVRWTAPEALKYGEGVAVSWMTTFELDEGERPVGLAAIQPRVTSGAMEFCCGRSSAWGGTPYAGLSNQQVMRQVERGFRMRAPRGCPMDIYDLMLRCWDHKPRLRPTFCSTYKELLQLRWYFE
ncbi:hypothetical protein lerEdw1_010628, partial [Lerista edwardsae]